MTALGFKPLAEAVAYRVFKQYPAIIVPGAFEAVRKSLDHPLLLGDFGEVQKMDVFEWLKSIKNGRRRRILMKAYKVMLESGEDPKIAMITPFVKTENLPFFSIVDGRPTVEGVTYVARLIQAPHDQTHVIAGPFLKPLTSALKKKWSAENWIYYASSPPEVLDGWLRSVANYASYYWSDYSAFDATYSRSSWNLIEGFYARVFKDEADYPELVRVLDMWRCPKGRAICRKEQRKLTYQSEEANASGRDDTALANALINGLAMSAAFAAALAGVAVSDLCVEHFIAASEKVRIAIVGDDSLVACTFDVRPYTTKIQSNLEEFGLVVKAECSLNLWDVTFLGCMPYQTSKGLYWGPTLGRRMYKAFWQVDDTIHLPAWTKGVAEQMMLCKHVPLMYEIGVRVAELLKGHSGMALFDENKPYQSRTGETVRWDASTIEWMCRRYPGLCAADFSADLMNVNQIRMLPCVMHSRVFQICVAQDDL